MSQPSFSIQLLADGGAGLAARTAERVAEIERDLERGGLFLPGVELPMDAPGTISLGSLGAPVQVTARVVFVSPAGVGLELSLTPAARRELTARLAVLRATLQREEGAPPPAHAAPAAGGAGGAPTAEPRAHAEGAESAEPLEPPDQASDQLPPTEAELAELERLAAVESPDADDPAPASPGHVPVHVRLRNLSLPDQLKIAHRGTLGERVVLERLYGKLVWEALLRNPRVTVPEVARIARMGALPRPLLEIILGNGAWLAVPEIRRALLGNPRLPAEHIPKLLRLLPRHELRLLPTATAYPVAVRDWARRLLRI